MKTTKDARRVVVTRSKTERACRRVALMIEAETDAPLADLRTRVRVYSSSDGVTWHAARVLQASANVIRAGKKGGRR